ncbi:MAG: MBL fold metallo-hydrolase [Thermodesulfobacteriota bacterium]|nr:MBL fold metallo-hydrolase [Thermodesulfobacteriota bacterium]
MTDTGIQKTSKSPLSVCMLASGSKGNAVYISNGETAILLDAGLSGIEIERRLSAINVKPETLDAILISHEHADHIRGAGILSRRYDLPLYINPATRRAAASQLGNIKACRDFECGAAFSVNTLHIHPFSLSHDAENPAGFTFQYADAKLGVATDLGIATGLVKDHLKECGILVLEANHDPEMLLTGSYPWPIKQRIKGRGGHLSNEDSKSLLCELAHSNLSHVVLAHLSGENNTPEKALSIVGQALTNTRTRVSVASQDKCGDILHVY